MCVKEAKMKGGACFEAYMAGLFKHVRFQLIFFLSFSCVCTCIQVCLGAPQVTNRLFCLSYDGSLRYTLCKVTVRMLKKRKAVSDNTCP